MESVLSILIADDNELNRWVLAEQLQPWSHDIVQVCDGVEAWDITQQRRFDLVFLDLGMPNLDGVSVMQRLRATRSYAKCPIIAVTAHLMLEQRAAIVAKGFDVVLLKPVMLSELQYWMSRFCGSGQIGDIAVYADALLQKVSHNRNLGEALFKKLLLDMPAQFESIDQALQKLDFDAAWMGAHKVDGTFCFYGFEDFRSIAQALEQALLERDVVQAGEQLQYLQRKFRGLIHRRQVLIDRLGTQGR